MACFKFHKWRKIHTHIYTYTHIDVYKQTYTHIYMWERYPYLELSSNQMSEKNNRPTVRNLILAKSQTSSLINQRCRLSFFAKCVSLSHAVCGCWSTLSSAPINICTHTRTLSLSLRYLALFPPLSVPFKSPFCGCLIINWNTDFTVLGCSHFIGCINTKYIYTHIYIPTFIFIHIYMYMCVCVCVCVWVNVCI